MKETNKEGERKIIKKYDKYCKKLFDSPKPSTSKINRLSICMKKFEESVEDLYV